MRLEAPVGETLDRWRNNLLQTVTFVMLSGVSQQSPPRELIYQQVKVHQVCHVLRSTELYFPAAKWRSIPENCVSSCCRVNSVLTSRIFHGELESSHALLEVAALGSY